MTPRLRIALTALSLAAPAAAHSCDTLAKLDLPPTTIASAESVPAGGFTPHRLKAISNLPAFCRVAGAIKASPGLQHPF